MEEQRDLEDTAKKPLQADIVTVTAPDDIEKSALHGKQEAVPFKQADAQAVWKPRNGGFEAWLQVAAGFFLSMNSW